MCFDNEAPAPPARKGRKTVRDKLAEALLALTGEQGQITAHSEKAWASITFAGARHTVEMVFDGADAVDAGECFIAFLPEHEFTIPGQLLADAAIVEVESVANPARLTVRCELLLLEEA